MAEEVEMTPITDAEGGGMPPKVAPFGATEAPAPAAPAAGPAVSTIKLKPVIRKPAIRKPTIGGPKPAMSAAAATPAPAKKATQNLKSVTGPIPVAASLKKTGIIAEGIITPAQQQASKSKTSRISLESAIGVAPAKEGPAPLKTIRLRRPADLNKPAGPTPLTPAAAAPAKPVAPAPVAAPTPEPAPMEPVSESPAPVADLGDDASVTQKKTLKLHRPGAPAIKRPTVGGAAPAGDAGVAEMSSDTVAPMAPIDFGAVPEQSGGSSVMAMVSVMVVLASLAVTGFLAYKLWADTQVAL